MVVEPFRGIVDAQFLVSDELRGRNRSAAVEERGAPLCEDEIEILLLLKFITC